MRRAIVLMLTLAAAMLFAPRLSGAAEEALAGGAVHATEAGGHGGELESGDKLVPVNEAAQKAALVQAVWTLIIFLILLAILYPTAWKGVLHGLKTREQRIRKDIADAEATRIKAEQTLADYNKQLATAEDRVRELLAKGQADGERLASTIRDSAGKEAEAIKSKAMADITDAGKQAVAEIHAQAAELSTAIAEKIIRRNLNVEDQRELVRASLQELEAGHRN